MNKLNMIIYNTLFFLITFILPFTILCLLAFSGCSSLAYGNCRSVKMINESDEEWTTRDYAEMELTKSKCSECLIRFKKTKEYNYEYRCGPERHHENPR